MSPLERSLMTISCRDTDAIPKQPLAGKVIQRDGMDIQVMHNGVEVVYGGYHGDWMAHVIRALRGHHEPQEERIFHSLMDYVRDRSLIVELGAFWAYYSNWYLKEIPFSRAICVESDPHNIGIGRQTVELNQTSERLRFIEAWIGRDQKESHSAATETSGEVAVTLPMIHFPRLCEIADGECIELLHMDIQGAELPFLESIDPAAKPGQVRFLVVSSHHSSISGSATTHEDCLERLRSIGASILVEHDVFESFSGDGLIVASLFPEDRDLHFPEISRNRKETSLFRGGEE